MIYALLTVILLVEVIAALVLARRFGHRVGTDDLVELRALLMNRQTHSHLIQDRLRQLDERNREVPKLHHALTRKNRQLVRLKKRTETALREAIDYVAMQNAPSNCGNNSGHAYWDELQNRVLGELHRRLALHLQVSQKPAEPIACPDAN